MNEVVPRSMQVYTNGYCSQIKPSFPPVRRIEEGVCIIDEILKKDMLCRHDVNNIKQAYSAIDFLERRIDTIPSECNSLHALQKVVERVKTIIFKKDVNSRDLITLHYLQSFSDGELHISKHFYSLFIKLQNDIDPIEIATQLPCCDSKYEFDKDIACLLGVKRSDEVNEILAQKESKLKSHELKKQKVISKKSELENLRKNHSENYPAYFDELLNEGFIYLYDHLVEMKALLSRQERRAKIEKMTFSSVSHVVLETREAIIRKVQNSIPASRNNILFLLGITGAGKSTTLCFLRGDVMVLENSMYVSQNKKEAIIGQIKAASCTFLPTIEVINDLVIVDFPGFDDTSGQAISLGMEFALLSLIESYQPKILVLEAITNVEGQFSAANKLGLRLSRLLKNKENCILGITKYSKDVDYIKVKLAEEKINTIEDQQKKELLAPTEEEYELNADIKQLSKPKYSSANSLEEIEQIKQRLNKIKLEKEKKLEKPLPDTPEKAENRKQLGKSKKNLEELQNELLRQIGLKNMIAFNDLENPSLLFSCLSDLSKPLEKKFIHVNTRLALDSEDKALIEFLLYKSLLKEIESKTDYPVNLKDFKKFEQRVLESSLVKTLFSQSNSEIGEFLHLPQMDPAIARNFDKELVNNCLTSLMNAAIRELNMSFINEVIQSSKVAALTEKIATLNYKMNDLKEYIKGLKGISISIKPGEADKEWERLQKEQETAVQFIEEGYKLPTWATVCLGLPLGVPLLIRTLFKWSDQNKAAQKTVEDAIDKCIKNTVNMLDVLHGLKGIEKIIKKREAIDNALNSAITPVKSIDDWFSSIDTKISKVRAEYGGVDWDRRVSYLSKKFDFYNTNPQFMLIYICSLMTPGTYFERFDKKSYKLKISSENEGFEVFVPVDKVPSSMRAIEDLCASSIPLTRALLAASILQALQELKDGQQPSRWATVKGFLSFSWF